MELVNPAPCFGIKDVPVYRVPVVVGAVKNTLADLVADIAGAFCGEGDAYIIFFAIHR